MMIPESTYRIAFLILLVALIAMRITYMVRVRRSGGKLIPGKHAVQREGGQVVLILRVVLFIALIVFLMMYFTGAAWVDTFHFWLPGWLRWTGFILGLFSVVFWTWTQIHLDTQWSAQLQLTRDHHLVTSGPYARIRHPLYTAMLGWFLSLILLTTNWIFFILCALSFAGLLWRIPKEERMMLDAFGTEYHAYMQRTGRFLPRI